MHGERGVLAATNLALKNAQKKLMFLEFFGRLISLRQRLR
jgi:hypothetical protein